MRGQPHLIVSQDPLEQGRTYTALCGKEIAEAVWVRPIEIGEVIDRSNTCQKCWPKLTVDDVTEYVYRTVSREDAEKELNKGAA